MHKAEPCCGKDLDEFERDPWNAVAVLGLRVYHKTIEGEGSENALRIKTVWPTPYSTAAADGDKEQEEKGKGLDVDDSAKDATLEGNVTERKESIIGDQRKGGG